MLNVEQTKNEEKIIMIVNGQPIEVCSRTLLLCNKRAQRLLTALKKQSLEEAKTLRLFWGDIIMLNILTNQLLQKIPSRTLARIVKPTKSLREDLQEYRDDRQKKVENLKNALIIANDPMLPLDYSRELEKYYKDDFSNGDSDDEKNNETTVTHTHISPVSRQNKTEMPQTEKETPKKETPKKKLLHPNSRTTSIGKMMMKK